MKYRVQILPDHITVECEEGEDLLTVLRRAGHAPESPCGGHGSCGKCAVLVDGNRQLACGTRVDRDMTVTAASHKEDTRVLTDGTFAMPDPHPVRDGNLLAIDIGTTTLAAFLMDPSGKLLASSGMLNPQEPFGADVISRIQLAGKGEMNSLTKCIREGLTSLTEDVCRKAALSPEEIGVVSIVGNPCMQQLFLGIDPVNLSAVPFAPVLLHSEVREAKDILPVCPNAALLIVPDIAGYVGADTMGCVLSTRMYAEEPVTLMVDIGTNGEMVLGNCHQMTACSTAAGPALEGARIRFGMRGAPGAIDHVWIEDGRLCCSVIGGGKAVGICGSGLIDAVACSLDLGLINKRGRIQLVSAPVSAPDSVGLSGESDASSNPDVPAAPELPLTAEINGERCILLTGDVYLTQNDIREVMMAKGAIAAGIVLMAKQQGLTPENIDRVLLAGAFGTFIRPESACRIGLLPASLNGKIRAVGNAAGSGARILAASREELERTDELLKKIDFIELASLPEFRTTFAKCMSL